MVSKFHFPRGSAVWLLALGCLVTAHAAVDQGLFTAILKTHVAGGHVDYTALRTDPRLDTYLAQVAATDPASATTRPEQLAFWINAYNAYTLKLIITHYPVASIRDIPHPGVASPWDLPIATVGGQSHTLNQIENDILRGRLKEPRIHYVIVCAAISCPPLRAEAYAADRLEAQFAEQARLFLTRQNKFDAQAHHAVLSSIFKWFATDFGSDTASVLRALAPFAPATATTSLASHPEKWTVAYHDYNWALNDRR